MSKLYSIGLGLGSKNNRGEWLDVFYPAPQLSPSAHWLQAASKAGYNRGNQVIELDKDKTRDLINDLEQNAIDTSLLGPIAEADNILLTVLAENGAPQTVPEGYLKLHLLSHRLVKPHETDLSGLFGILPNVAWTNQGAIDLGELPAKQLAARLSKTSTSRIKKYGGWSIQAYGHSM